MPYLDSKIEPNRHKKNCINPVAKRLYIRDYDDNGKQAFVSWGLTCTTCGVVIKQKYQPNLTPKELKRKERHIRLEGSKYSKSVGKLGGRPYGTWKEQFQRNQDYKLRNKLDRLQRKKLGPTPMSPEEVGLRTRIGHLKQFYELMSLHWGDLDIAWDDELVEKFLNISPRPTKTELAEVFQPSWSKVNVDSQKWRRYAGFVDDPDKQGWLKYDREKYKDLLKYEALKRQEMMREIIKRRKKIS